MYSDYSNVVYSKCFIVGVLNDSNPNILKIQKFYSELRIDF